MSNPYLFSFEAQPFVTRPLGMFRMPSILLADPKLHVMISGVTDGPPWRESLAALKLSSPAEYRALVRALWPRRDPFASRRVATLSRRDS